MLRCTLVRSRTRYYQGIWGIRVDDAAEWRPIPGYAPYEASDRGRVRNGATGRLLASTQNDSGYLYVSLMVGGQHRGHRVHRLVYLAFHGPIPHGHVVHHKDRDRANPRPSNLKAVTQRENVRHTLESGPGRRGSKGPTPPAKKSEALMLLLSGNGINEVARATGIPRTTVSRFRRALVAAQT